MLSEKEYKEMAKAKRNAEYLAKLEHSYRQLERGEVVHKTLEELRTIIDE